MRKVKAILISLLFVASVFGVAQTMALDLINSAIPERVKVGQIITVTTNIDPNSYDTTVKIYDPTMILHMTDAQFETYQDASKYVTKISGPIKKEGEELWTWTYLANLSGTIVFGLPIDPASPPQNRILTNPVTITSKGLPIDWIMKNLKENRCKNHPDLEGCKVIATENYVRLDGTQFKLLIENKEDIYLIDVRTEQMYSDGHLSGAVNIPYSKLGDMISTIPKGRKVVLYCKTGQTSIKSAEFLVKNNFDNIYVVTDGYDVLLGLGIK